MSDGRLRLGVTMRVVRDAATGETRDALAHDWRGFLDAAAPEALWLPLPNVGAAAGRLLADWALDGLVLTGGDDLGATPVRDETERALLAEALSRSLPTLAVCRGLQLAHDALGGGALGRCDAEKHVARRHVVRFEAGCGVPTPGGGEREVNSYHRWAVPTGTLRPPLVPVARSADGFVEAARHRSRPLLAVQWHPEREAPVDGHDRALVRWLFGLNENDDRRTHA